MVKTILKQELVDVPEEVTVSVKSKVVTVEGPKGSLTRSFRSVPIQIVEIKKEGRVAQVMVRIWFAKSKPKSCVNTVCKHIRNMITGVTKGYKYVMKYGYSILPMQPVAIDGGKTLQVVNYLGQKYIRKIKACDGVTIKTGENDAKKEIFVTGIDPSAVGLTCALINQNCTIRNVDRRKFKDGIYIFSRQLDE